MHQRNLCFSTQYRQRRPQFVRDTRGELLHFTDRFFKPLQRFVELDSELVQLIVRSLDWKPSIETRHSDFPRRLSQRGDGQP